MLKNTDERIVNGNLKFVVDELELYLENANFEITEKKLQESRCFLTAENRNKSFFKLFWTARPQITKWKIEKYSNEEVKVEAKVSSFRPFKYYFYTILLFLLSFACIFFVETISLKGEYDLCLKTFSIFLALLISACGFIQRFIGTKAYSFFFDGYYKKLQKVTLNKEKSIQIHPSCPENVRSIIIFLSYFLLGGYFAAIESIKGIGALWIPIVLLGLLVALLFVIIFSAEKTAKAIFLLTAIPFCLPLAIYSNLPILLLGTKPAFRIANQIVNKEKLFNKKVKINPEISKKNKNEVKKVKSALHKFSIIIFVYSAIIVFVAIIIFQPILYLPVVVLRRIDNFDTRNKESLYFKSMKSTNLVNPFNCCVIGIWLLLGIANLIGLCLSLAVLFKIFNIDNFPIRSEISDLFFNGTRMMISYLLYNHKSSDAVHAFFMLIYALPMPLLYSLVVIKNIKSTLQITSVLKSNQNGGIISNLMPKIEKICHDCKLRLPIIKIVDSENISEGANYLGFPVFRNLLIIKKQTVEILNQKDYALEAYLAHEIFHLKKHTLVWKILCLLSDFTLFGNGFLTILHSSYNVELEADAFAVKWLKQHDMPPTALITALQSQEQLEEQEVLGTLLSNLNFIHSIENEEYRETIIMQADNSGRLKKMLINLKLLYQMYFGSYITSYIHPGNEYRIEQIEGQISENV